MSRKKSVKNVSPEAEDRIIEQHMRQLHIDLKRALTTYVLMFLLKIRPHYAFEIRKKAVEIGELISDLSGIEEPKVVMAPKVVYDNFKKLEQKGIVGSYVEESEVGPDRKYYYLTELGERLFDGAVMKVLYPRLLLFVTAVEHRLKEWGEKSGSIKKETDKLQHLLNDVFNS
jgi:DNA-binding PadR family transcriptional regulator